MLRCIGDQHVHCEISLLLDRQKIPFNFPEIDRWTNISDSFPGIRRELKGLKKWTKCRFHRQNGLRVTKVSISSVKSVYRKISKCPLITLTKFKIQGNENRTKWKDTEKNSLSFYQIWLKKGLREGHQIIPQSNPSSPPPPSLSAPILSNPNPNPFLTLKILGANSDRILHLFLRPIW